VLYATLIQEKSCTSTLMQVISHIICLVEINDAEAGTFCRFVANLARTEIAILAHQNIKAKTSLPEATQTINSVFT